MKKLSIAAVFLFLISNSIHAVFRFTDDASIPQWAYESVQRVQSEKIIQGFPDGSFQPDKILNRAEALVLLFRTKKIEHTVDSKNPRKFSDVPTGKWFTSAVDKAVNEEWITGFEDGTFRPAKELNRAEWATLIMRAFKLTPDPDKTPDFKDVPSKVWFTDAVYSMYKHDLIRYPNAENFDPSRAVTRAEAAWIINTILNKPGVLGTEAGTTHKNGVSVGSRDVALPLPGDFNPNNQGVASTRKELSIIATGNDAPITVHSTSDWQNFGNIRFSNPFADRVTLNSLELALRFEKSGIGPSSEFEIEITGPKFQKTQSFDRTGRIFITGINMDIPTGEEKVFKVQIKPKENGRFYVKSGEASLVVESAEATTIDTFTTEKNNSSSSYGKNNLKRTPIKYTDRTLSPLSFQYP